MRCELQSDRDGRDLGGASALLVLSAAERVLCMREGSEDHQDVFQESPQ